MISKYWLKFATFGGAGAGDEGAVNKRLELTGFSGLTIFVWGCQRVSRRGNTFAVVPLCLCISWCHISWLAGVLPQQSIR